MDYNYDYRIDPVEHGQILSDLKHAKEDICDVKSNAAILLRRIETLEEKDRKLEIWREQVKVQLEKHENLKNEIEELKKFHTPQTVAATGEKEKTKTNWLEVLLSGPQGKFIIYGCLLLIYFLTTLAMGQNQKDTMETIKQLQELIKNGAALP